jgi:hypothetical protein
MKSFNIFSTHNTRSRASAFVRCPAVHNQVAGIGRCCLPARLQPRLLWSTLHRTIMSLGMCRIVGQMITCLQLKRDIYSQSRLGVGTTSPPKQFREENDVMQNRGCCCLAVPTKMPTGAIAVADQSTTVTSRPCSIADMLMLVYVPEECLPTLYFFRSKIITTIPGHTHF